MVTRTQLIIPAAAAAIIMVAAGCGTSTTNNAIKHPGSPAVHTAVAVDATSPPPSPAAAATVTTTGTGTVSGTPDTLTFSIDVSTTAAHVASALGQNNTIAAAVQQVLEHDGLTAADIQTSNVSLQQNYSGSTPSGYEADDTITAIVHGLANAGTIIDNAIVAAGDSGRLDGVTLSMSNTNPVMAAARAQAVAAARTQAQQLASAAGEPLGRLISLTDQPADQDNTYPEAFSASASAAATPVPIQAGSQQASIQVTGVWALGS
jgi:hypothetical protein